MENSSGGALDLLSAALNQSGLMDGGILSSHNDGIAVGSGMVSGHSDDPLLEALTTEADSLESGTTDLVDSATSSVTCTQSVAPARIVTVVPSTVASRPEGSVIATSSNVSLQPVKSIRIAKPPPGCKVISGLKVLKLPTLKAGSIVKIDKLGKANIIRSDFKPASSTQVGRNVVNALAKPVSVNGLESSTHSVVTTLDTAKKTSSGTDITFKKTVVNGKTILIPVQNSQVVESHKTTVTAIKTIPVASVVRTASHRAPHLVKSKSFSLGNVATNHAVDQQSSVRPISKPNPLRSSGMKLTLTKNTETRDSNSPTLNLGSMFVESAEKAVGSDFETPPASPYSVVVNDTNKHASNLLKLDNHSFSSQPPSSRFYRKKIDAINGNAPFYDHLKRSSNSIPTIDLTQANDRSSAEKNKLFGSSALPRTVSLPSMPKQPGEELVAEDEKEEESGMQNAQTYAEYMPSKLQIGLPHPDSVVETSSLASIIPPDVHYRLSIPKEAIDLCRLSALQLECVTYAAQKHNTFLRSGERAGYLIGDGAGVGKGRSVAGIIYENYLVGRKRALWFSVSNDLRYDAERDLRDIGAKHIKVYPLNKFKYGKITARNNGAVKKGVIFATYSSLIGESHSQAKYHTRLKQILHWCGEDFDGVIIFDECHKAKNLVPSGAGKSTKTGITVVELQRQLPNARVVYASATGASEPRNMAYMSRLGLWGPGTPFHDFMDFIQAVERRGVGAMELVAMDMKLRGSYIARQLSFYGVSFKINEVSLDSSFTNMYNKAVKLWMIAREAFQAAASMMEAEYHMKKSMWAMFWSAHQRFFKYLCISAKVKHTVSLVREAVKHGKCVVIGMQSTGEASTIDQLEKAGGELDDFVSTAKAVLENLIDRHFPAPDRKRVTALFGKDFYKQSSTEQEKETSHKRKMPINGKRFPPLKKARRGSESSGDEASSTSESADEDQAELSSNDDNLSLASLDSTGSDEDIGRIFGDASDSEDNESPVKKKAKLRKKSSSSNKEDDSDDPGLTLEGLMEVDEDADLLSSIDAVSGTLTSSLPGMGPVERAQALKHELLNRLEVLGPSLPNNMLDELIDALGGPENVAEMTGRKGRVIATDDGTVEYQTRAETDVPVELLNMKEKQRFMDGEKNIAIISEAASSGISLQADKRARNQRRRVHVTLELPWSADRAIQQFGRTHRSNQVNAPEYVFLITELAGEQRFASIVAKRLESLGALTHGDRRATETRDLSKYNYDNKYGRKALDSVMKSIAGYDAPLVAPPSSYKGHFFKDIRQSLLGVGLITREAGQAQYQLDKDYNNIFKFMNRMLGMEVDRQNALFRFFSDTMQAIIMEAKRLGQYDQGIVDVGAGSDSVERVKCSDFPVSSGGTASLHTVRVERGTSWEEGLKICRESSVGEDSGFYVTFQKRNGKHMVMLAIEYKSRRQRGPSLFLVYRPNTGKQTRREALEDIKKKYRRCSEEEAGQWWVRHYQASLEQCTHEFWQGVCNRGGIASCHVGKRRRTYHVLSGSVLGVWRTVEYVLSVEGGNKYKMQIVRLKTSDGGKLVGLLIPSTCTTSLITALSSENDEADQSQHDTSVSRNSCDIMSDDSDDYEDVEEIEPDEMLSSVLFSKRQFSWTT